MLIHSILVPMNDPYDVLILTSIPPGGEDGTLKTLGNGILSPINDSYVYTYFSDNTLHGDVLLYKASDGTSETDVHAAIFNFSSRRDWQRFVAPTALEDAVNIAEDEVKEVSLFGYDVFFDSGSRWFI